MNLNPELRAQIEADLKSISTTEEQLWLEVAKAEDEAKPYNEKLDAAQTAWFKCREQKTGLEALLR